MKQGEITTLPDGSLYKESTAFRVSNGKCDNVAFRGFPDGPYEKNDKVGMKLFTKDSDNAIIKAGDILIRKLK